jgi:glycine oxidase
LQGLSDQLHPVWHERLADKTGIDNGYRLSGAIYLGGNPDFEASTAEWARFGVAYQELDERAIADMEPALAVQRRGFMIPGEAQIRPPRHLKALAAACQRLGVVLRPGCQLLDWHVRERRITGAITSTGTISAGDYCVTSGCWSGAVARRMGLEIPVRPVRGQIMLLRGPIGTLNRIINWGSRYITSRPDGRVLVGSTQEEAGFDKRNTVEGIAELAGFARMTCPALATFTIEKVWSGLRPRTVDDLPYLGRLPRFENAWIAAGHFRAGIQLSAATAVVMRSLMLGEIPPVDLNGLGPSSRVL